MILSEPINQIKLFGLDKYINELIALDSKNNLPNKILLSGQKGLGKSTLAYHFINFMLSKNEDFKYDIDNFEINPKNQSYKTTLNKSNPNLISINFNLDNKPADMSQIRSLITTLNKSSFNDKPRFILIDNIESLKINSINAILKVLEEPSLNVHYILINNNKKVLPTVLSRCINFKISLTNETSLEVSSKLLDENIYNIINEELINYYLTPGNIYKLVNFSNENGYNLRNTKLKDFLKLIIENNHYKKNSSLQHIFFELIEFYFSRINSSMSLDISNKYDYFLKKFSDTKRFNLDEETLLIEFEDIILNG